MSSHRGYPAGRLVGTYDWPHTRIRRRGLAALKNHRMRLLFKSSSVTLAIFLIFALAYVWTRVQVIETGYQLRQLEVEREKLKEENRSLSVEAATLRSPQRLEEVASRLGLKRPGERQVYFINEEVTIFGVSEHKPDRIHSVRFGGANGPASGRSDGGFRGRAVSPPD